MITMFSYFSHKEPTNNEVDSLKTKGKNVMLKQNLKSINKYLTNIIQKQQKYFLMNKSSENLLPVVVHYMIAEAGQQG